MTGSSPREIELYLWVDGSGDDADVGKAVGQSLDSQSCCQHRHKDDVLLRYIMILGTERERGEREREREREREWI